ncbi:MAG: NAD(P)-dependent oxidoreductase [Cyanobacteria bacterium HKST-UBA02]|nr:NAD(P)-dependent oxidoreductase [Cyanobacteria bacterium HKST-UBA02]
MTELAIVTGAPGWLGTALVRSLVQGLEEAGLPATPGRQVRVGKLPGSDDDELKVLGDQVIATDCDITDRASVDRLLEGASGATLFHSAGIIHPSKGRQQFYDVNVEGTRNLIEAAEKAGVRRFIHVSSNSPVGINESRDKLFDENSPCRPYMHYGKSKKAGEDLVNAAFKRGNMETVIIRPPWFYGPGQPPRQSLFFTMIKNGKGPIVGGGENLRSMAYVDNICQGLLLCEQVEKANGQTYWIADRRPYTMNEIIDTIEGLMENEFGMKVAHKRMRLPGIASEVAYVVDLLIQSAGLYHQKFHVLSEMNKDIACSIARAEAELGYDPKIELAEGMRRSIRWVLDQGREI